MSKRKIAPVDTGSEIFHKKYFVEAPQVSVLERAGFTLKEESSYIYSIQDAILSPSWRIGGLTGGSCWGSIADQPVTADEKPDWLEELVETTCPDISFAKFRKILQAVRKFQYTRGEYYGNYTEYAFEVLKISDFLEILADES
jgi:hypothetical protein